MSIHALDEPTPPLRRFALFALGFRPFFLAAGVAATLLMAVWLVVLAGPGEWSNYFPPTIWHGHEMVFGYATAVIAGFLLTAVRNWTNLPTATGVGLAALAGLWLAGRITPFFPDALPPGLIAAIDLAFLPTVALAVSIPVWKAGQRHNFQFAILLLLLTLANALTHPALNDDGVWARQGLYLGANLILFLMAVMGGRVIPFFIERAVEGARNRTSARVDLAALLGIALVTLLEFAAASAWAVAVTAMAAAAANAIRLAGWHHPGLWREPLLWVLFLGYGWLVVALGLKGLAAQGWLAPSTALHALTVGGIGVLTLGMMPRVALGHTGRPMRAPRAIPTAFVLLNLAVLSRVALPALIPESYTLWVNLAGALWCGAFALFVLRYAPVLLRPRVDGRPG